MSQMALNSFNLQSQNCRDPVSLPPEVIKLIAHHLQDNRQALHTCLLVSRAWSQVAVEYLYKAEHMMTDRYNLSFPADDPLSLSLAEINLNDCSEISSALTPALRSVQDCLPTTERILEPELARMCTDLLLKRTLESSLLHDNDCSYDYISYINKVSCPWLSSLIYNWEKFCSDWRGSIHPTHDAKDTKLGASATRQEHCFNRLVRKLSKRSNCVDDFRSSSMIQQDTLVYAIRHFKNLTRIDLKDSQDLDDSVFQALSSTVHTLTYVRLPGLSMKNVSPKAVADMILSQRKDGLTQFKVIHGTNIFEDDSILKALGERHSRSLQRLTLSICDLEHSGLQEYGPLLSNMISLNLEYASGVTDDVILPILDSCRALVKLDLTETDCAQGVIHGLSTASDKADPQPGRFTEMRRLILNNIDAPFTTNLFLPLADACPNLEELHMNSILADSFQDFELFITKTKKLRDLDIGNVFPEFTDSDLTKLVDALPNLRWLSVANTQITNESLIYLAKNAKNICDLCVLGCDQLTKAGLIEFLESIAINSGFKRLDITYCRLEEGAVSDIRDWAKTMAIQNGLLEVVEIEGDDQFVDSLVEDGEREDGEEQEEGDDEDEDGDDNDESITQDENITSDNDDGDNNSNEVFNLAEISTDEETLEEDGYGADDLESEELSDFSDTLSELAESEDEDI